MTVKKKKTRAPGAGRPPIDPQLVKVQTGIALPRWLNNWLSDQPKSKAQLIEEALIKVHKLKKPLTKIEGLRASSRKSAELMKGTLKSKTTK